MITTQQMTDIRAAIVEMSGSGKKLAPGARKNGIYTSFTLDGLTDLTAVRDTMQRFRDYGIPDTQRFDGKTVLDVGCNVGAVSMEWAMRGARVDGLEFRPDRVALCNEIARLWLLGSHARFYQADFNAMLPVLLKHDVVWCSSVDEYIDDAPAFYAWLVKGVAQGGVLYLESNLQGRGLSDPDNLRPILKDAGASSVAYCGNGDSGGVSRKRKLYEVRP